MSVFGLPLVTFAYLVFYSAYDKRTGRISTSLLQDFVLARRGLEFTLLEMNKLVSLVGLTLLCLSIIFADAALLTRAEICTLTHSVFSLYHFYGFTWKRAITNNPKRLAISIGLLGQVILFVAYWHLVAYRYLVAFALPLGVIHFISIEMNDDNSLKIRPFAYLPFPLAIIALIRYAAFGGL